MQGPANRGNRLAMRRGTKRSSEALRVGDVGEQGLLERIAARFGRFKAPGVLVSIGDDAAVLKQIGPGAVLSTDMLVEGVDFDFAWTSPTDVGAKAAAANLSDLAAMGAKPRCLMLSLGLRTHDRVKDVLALMTAFAAVGRPLGAPLVGGDLSRVDGPLVVSVTVIGEGLVRRLLRRHYARAHDIVLVSGALGGAAAGLALLRAGRRTPRQLVARQLRPRAQVALGLALARSGLVTSAADISDGLAKDALHLVPPHLGVELLRAQLPLAPGLAVAAKSLGADPLAWALSGGEDFELALTVRPCDVVRAQRLAARVGETLTPVGTVVARPGLSVVGSTLPRGGFDHFQSG